MKTQTAIAPATSANVGPGFDVLGFALAAPYAKVTATLVHATGSTVTITCADPTISTDLMRNTAGAAALSLLAQLHSTTSIQLHVESEIPVGSGLGSSAASAVAAVVAVNALLGSPLKPTELLSSALDGETVASGARHADNIAPSLLGGFVVIRSHDPLDCLHVVVPPALHYIIVHPHLQINTAEARRILPTSVPLTTATQQWGNVAMLIAALSAGDTAAVGRAFDDKIVEPVRAALIPGYNSVKLAALSAGAVGCTISGSGPSLLALCDATQKIEGVRAAMVKAFDTVGLKTDSWTGSLQNPGARLI